MRNAWKNAASGDATTREIPSRIEEIRAPRVLVVDDEPLMRWSIAETLGELGCQVIEAGDARTALELVGTDVHLVLLDLLLPDCVDLSVLSRMRRLVPSTPVILMSASATPITVREAAACGVPVIPKPFELADLAAHVRRALSDRIY
jgi:DNA-binding NtrC family response regulator